MVCQPTATESDLDRNKFLPVDNVVGPEESLEHLFPHSNIKATHLTDGETEIQRG